MPDIESVIEMPLQNIVIPYSYDDYFELFVRLDLLKDELDRIRKATFSSEEARDKKIKQLRRAIDTITRHVMPEVNANGQKQFRRGDIQRQLILDELNNLGFDARHLNIEPGKPSAKRQVFDLLRAKQKNFFPTRSTFDSVWKRMRSTGDIQSLKTK